MKYLLISIATFIGSVAVAQNATDYAEFSKNVLKAEKQALISESIQFTEEESTIFWPIFNEFNDKLMNIETKNYVLIMDYANNYETMTNEKADELWSAYMKNETERVKLMTQYYNKLKKVIPAAKAAKYFQIENKLDAIVDAALAVEIPVIEIK